MADKEDDDSFEWEDKRTGTVRKFQRSEPGWGGKIIERARVGSSANHAELEKARAQAQIAHRMDERIKKGRLPQGE